MTGHHESTGPDPELSSDSLRRVTQYQTAGVNAQVKLFALLEAQGAPASEADDLVAGAVAGAQCEVVERDRYTGARGEEFRQGWHAGVMAVSKALVGIVDRDWVRREGRSAGAAELVVHIADVRQRERADLVRLEAFVREAVLPHAPAHHRAAPGAGGAGRCRRPVHGADGGAVQRGRHPLHMRGRALRPGRQAVLHGRKVRRLASRGWVDLEQRRYGLRPSLGRLNGH
ncbi:hypothetical protein GCM10010315_57310 [Streptomyces luteosporeus]|uniref:Uncharacterized protein n=1 Tax=Streptomyces luteosporeus TaxID=173856 RepID=A0ABP6GKF9_9ACTN